MNNGDVFIGGIWGSISNIGIVNVNVPWCQDGIYTINDGDALVVADDGVVDGEGKWRLVEDVNFCAGSSVELFVTHQGGKLIGIHATCFDKY